MPSAAMSWGNPMQQLGVSSAPRMHSVPAIANRRSDDAASGCPAPVSPKAATRFLILVLVSVSRRDGGFGRSHFVEYFRPREGHNHIAAAIGDDQFLIDAVQRELTSQRNSAQLLNGNPPARGHVAVFVHIPGADRSPVASAYNPAGVGDANGRIASAT